MTAFSVIFQFLIKRIRIVVKFEIICLFSFFSLGDALCTIAASTCFQEPFEVPQDRRRLGWVHKKFSGNRNSDHLAMLWAFQQWEDSRYFDLIF